MVDGCVFGEGEELANVSAGEGGAETMEAVGGLSRKGWPSVGGMGGGARRESVGRREGGGQVGEEARDGEGGVGVLGKECSVGKLLQ